jgi:hypothetical protein
MAASRGDEDHEEAPRQVSFPMSVQADTLYLYA